MGKMKKEVFLMKCNLGDIDKEEVFAKAINDPVLIKWMDANIIILQEDNYEIFDRKWNVCVSENGYRIAIYKVSLLNDKRNIGLVRCIKCEDCNQHYAWTEDIEPCKCGSINLLETAEFLK